MFITPIVARAQLGNNGPIESSESSLVVCFGEMLIDFVPTSSGLSLAEAPAFKKAPGGAPANVAVGIARLGGASAFIGKVITIIGPYVSLSLPCFVAELCVPLFLVMAAFHFHLTAFLGSVLFFRFEKILICSNSKISFKILLKNVLLVKVSPVYN